MKSYYARILSVAGATLLAMVALTAFAAEEKDTGPMMTPEQAQQMMGGYGYGMGMGPGMMGPGGMGMMGGMGPGGMGMMGGMGPGGMGMMGGMGSGGMGMMGGMGSGMMGMGPAGMGMMGMGPMGMLDLSDEQQSKVGEIMDATRKQQWDLMGRMMDEQSRLRDLYAQDKPDPKQVGAVYAKIFDLKRQMIENGVAAHNSMYDSLTSEQRDELKNRHRGMPGCGGYGPGPRGRMPMGGGMMGNQ
jgi:Spy/CpxP family protein refolding chaperone